jgi:hypothetical protein
VVGVKEIGRVLLVAVVIAACAVGCTWFAGELIAGARAPAIGHAVGPATNVIPTAIPRAGHGDRCKRWIETFPRLQPDGRVFCRQRSGATCYCR